MNIDPRAAVAKETTIAWLDRTFAIPLSLRSEVSAAAKEQRESDIHDAIFDSLPRGVDRAKLLGLAEAARTWLIRGKTAATWPTPAEVVEAFRKSAPKESSERGWPHRNSEEVISAAVYWATHFHDWPRWLEFEVEVMREVLGRGLLTEAQLKAAGAPIWRLSRASEYIEDAS